jgi:PhzF family phenazine biosynthesis protein
MTERRFIQCDVFTAIPTRGNGLAVVIDGDGLTDAAMQAFAAWTNLAETTFLSAPISAEADYRIRIFTPKREMPFAGHPTLGSCAAWLRTGGVPKTPGMVRQDCGVGVVEIDISGAIPAFVAPPTRIAALPDALRERIVATLQIDPRAVRGFAQLNNGPEWNLIELGSADDVLAVDASLVSWPDFTPIGLIGAHAPDAECRYEVRMFAPSSGMVEDPITGSLNAAIAHWLQAQGRLTDPIVVAQGTRINRVGRIHIRPDPSDPARVMIGGETQILIEGTLTL